MAVYLDLATFKSLATSIRPEDVDVIETAYPGYTAGRIAQNSSLINDRLKKRYGDSIPFTLPAPTIVINWLVALVTVDVWNRHGRDITDPALAAAKQDYDRADAQIKEAADSAVGLFELPFTLDAAGSAVSAGGPLGFADASPFAWTDRQRTDARIQDAQGRAGYRPGEDGSG